MELVEGKKDKRKFTLATRKKILFLSFLYKEITFFSSRHVFPCQHFLAPHFMKNGFENVTSCVNIIIFYLRRAETSFIFFELS